MERKKVKRADMFRRIALSLPEVIEQEHMGHPDFRVPKVKGKSKGKIFATLFYSSDEVDDEDRGMVKLTPDQQEEFMALAPTVFCPIKGNWGKQGCTEVDLSCAKAAILKKALTAAWRNAAPKRLLVRASRYGRPRAPIKSRTSTMISSRPTPPLG